MALTKVKSAGVNLSDNFAFTGTVTGTNTLIEVISNSTTAVTGATSIEID